MHLQATPPQRFRQHRTGDAMAQDQYIIGERHGAKLRHIRTRPWMLRGKRLTPPATVPYA
jgi:hypothetical protein